MYRTFLIFLFSVSIAAAGGPIGHLSRASLILRSA